MNVFCAVLDNCVRQDVYVYIFSVMFWILSCNSEIKLLNVNKINKIEICYRGASTSKDE